MAVLIFKIIFHRSTYYSANTAMQLEFYHHAERITSAKVPSSILIVCGNFKPFLAFSHNLSKVDIGLLWCQTNAMFTLQARSSPSIASILITCLLLASGTLNRTLACQGSTFRLLGRAWCINSGYLNVRSAVHKAAMIHNLINEHHLYILTLQKMTSHLQPAILAGVMLYHFKVLHGHRQLAPTVQHMVVMVSPSS